MASVRRGPAFLVSGAICLATGIAAGLGGITYWITKLDPVAKLEVPGEVEVEIKEAGPHTLWHGLPVEPTPAGRAPEDLPAILVRKSDGREFELRAILSPGTAPSWASSHPVLGRFDPDQPGTYTLQANPKDGGKSTVSLTRGNYLRTGGTFLLFTLSGGVLFLGGLLLAVLGIVFLVSPQGTTGPPASSESPP